MEDRHYISGTCNLLEVIILTKLGYVFKSCCSVLCNKKSSLTELRVRSLSIADVQNLHH